MIIKYDNYRPIPSLPCEPRRKARRAIISAILERFAVVSDLINVRKYPNVIAPVYSTISNENPAFVIQIDDFDHRNPTKLNAMRKMHRQVRGSQTASGRDFTDYIATKFPVFHVWDDHDYGMNNGDKTFSGKSDAIRAFKEYYPIPPLANPNASIWHKFIMAIQSFICLI